MKEASMHMSRKNYSKGELIKRMMREQKASFGALLETKKQKMQRLKQESSGSITKSENNRSKQDDSEFSWMMNVSQDRLRRIRVNFDKKIEARDPQDVCLSDFVPSFEKRIFPAYSDLQLPRVQKTIIHQSSSNKNKFTFTVVDKNYVPVSKARNHQKRPSGTYSAHVRGRIWNTQNIPIENSRSNVDLEKSQNDLESRLLPVSTVHGPVTPKLETTNSEPEKMITKTTTLIPRPRAERSRLEIMTVKVKKAAAKSTTKRTKPKIIYAEPDKVSANLDSCSKSNLNSQVQNILENIKTAELYTETSTLEKRQETALDTKQNLKFLRFPIVGQVLEATMSTRQQSSRQWYIEKFIEGFGQEVFDEYRQGEK